MGDKAKPLAAYRPTALLCWKDRRGPVSYFTKGAERWRRAGIFQIRTALSN
jgi:hypothetical protein